MLAWGLLPFVISWIVAISSFGFHLPWGETDDLNHLGHLWKPVLFVFELVFLGIVFAPILSGLMGIWGLSRKLLTWTIGYYLTIIGIHAILTFEGITESVDLGLTPSRTDWRSNSIRRTSISTLIESPTSSDTFVGIS